MGDVQYKCCVNCGFILCQIIKDQRGRLRYQEFHISMDEEYLVCSCGQKYRRITRKDCGISYEPYTSRQESLGD